MAPQIASDLQCNLTCFEPMHQNGLSNAFGYHLLVLFVITLWLGVL